MQAVIQKKIRRGQAITIIDHNEVTIRLIDVSGKELTTRSLGHLSGEAYKSSFNTRNFTNGVYFIEFSLGSEKIVERFIVKE